MRLLFLVTVLCSIAARAEFQAPRDWLDDDAPLRQELLISLDEQRAAIELTRPSFGPTIAFGVAALFAVLFGLGTTFASLLVPPFVVASAIFLAIAVVYGVVTHHASARVDAELSRLASLARQVKACGPCPCAPPIDPAPR